MSARRRAGRRSPVVAEAPGSGRCSLDIERGFTFDGGMRKAIVILEVDGAELVLSPYQAKRLRSKLEDAIAWADQPPESSA